MRLALQNPVVFAITVFGAVSLIVALAWALLAPPIAPPIERQIQDARHLIQSARAGASFLPLDYKITIPAQNAVATDERKALFFAKFLPLIVAENARIAEKRQAIQNQALAPAQLNALGLAYGLKPQSLTIERLLKRVDVLPVSLVLAQAAIESAWGTSRFAREGRAYFGERTFDPDDPGIAPKRANGFKVKSFKSAQMSVRSYMRTLNTHLAYEELRERRAQSRTTGQPLNSQRLARYLKDYSEIGGSYISLIERTIVDNQLDDFDRISIAPH